MKEENNFTESVTHIVERLLGKKPIDHGMDFFTQGADELTLFRLLNKLNQEFPHIRLSWGELIDHCTVQSLTQLMVKNNDNSPKADPQKRFIQLSATERRSQLECLIKREFAHVPNLSLTEETTNLNQLDAHLVHMNLAWALKRDFQLPIYPQEIESKTTIADLARYLVEELEKRVALQQRKPKAVVAQNYQPNREKKYVSCSIVPETKRVKNMALLLSAPRSGSTLLRLMLAGHSQLFCPPELNLLHHDALPSWVKNRLNRFPRSSRVIQNLMTLMGFSREESERILESPQQHKILVADLYTRIFNYSHAKTVVDKTPSYAKNIQTLLHAETIFQDAKYIHLIRHPYAMIDSFVRHRFEKLLGKPDVDPYVCAENVWWERNCNILTLQQQVNKDRFHLVRYEELVQNPRTTIEALSQFLQVPFEEATLTPYEGNRSIGGPGDYDIFQHSQLDKQLGDAWKDVCLPHMLNPGTVELAEQFGYDLAKTGTPI